MAQTGGPNAARGLPKRVVNRKPPRRVNRPAGVFGQLGRADAPITHAQRQAHQRTQRAQRPILKRVNVPYVPKLAHPTRSQRSAAVQTVGQGLHKQGVTSSEVKQFARGQGTRSQQQRVNRYLGGVQTQTRKLQAGVGRAAPVQGLAEGITRNLIKALPGAEPPMSFVDPLVRGAEVHQRLVPSAERQYAQTGRQVALGNLAQGSPYKDSHLRGGIGPATIDLTAASNAIGSKLAGNPISAFSKGLSEIAQQHLFSDKGVLGRTANDLLTYPAAAVPTAYELTVHPQKFVTGIADQLSHPVALTKEHPLFAALALHGGVSALGRTGGAIARSGALGSTLKEAAGTSRNMIGLAGESGARIRTPRSYSKDVFRKAAQVAYDKRLKPVRDAKGDVVRDARGRPVMAAPENSRIYSPKRLQQQRATFITSRANARERHARTVASRLVHAAQPTRERRGVKLGTIPSRGPVPHALRGKTIDTAMVGRAVDRSLASQPATKVRVLGKRFYRPEKDVVAMAMEGTLRSPETFHADLIKERQRLEAAYKDPNHELDPLQKRTNRIRARTIDRVLNDKRAMANAQGVFASARELAAHGNKLADRLVEQKLLDPAAAARAKLFPYAQSHMGARYVDQQTATKLSQHARRQAQGARQDVKAAQQAEQEAAAQLAALHEVKTPAVNRDYNPTPEAINQQTWYHGTGTSGLTKEHLDSTGTRADNLFGQGVYLTNDPEIAKGYATARGRHTGQEHIYEASTNIKNPLDLEAPAHPKFAQILATRAKHLVGIGDDELAAHILDLAKKPGTTNDNLYAAFRHGVSDFSHREEISASELLDDFQVLTGDLRKAGWDALTHVGGKRTGKEAHQVVIALDPMDANAIGTHEPVSRFDPHTPGPTASPEEIAAAQRVVEQASTRRQMTEQAHRAAVDNLRQHPKTPSLRDAEGRFLSNERIHAHMRESGIDPQHIAYLPHRNDVRGARAYHQQFRLNRPNLDRESRTGAAYVAGATDSGFSLPLEHIVHATTTLTRAHEFDKLIGDVGIKHPSGRYFTWKEAQAYAKFGGRAPNEATNRRVPGEPQLVPVRAVPAKYDEARAQAIEQAQDPQVPGAADRLVREQTARFDGPDPADVGARNVVLVPKEVADRIQENLKPSTSFDKRFQGLTSAFRTTVLPFSTKWLTGNVVEAVLRSGVAGVSPHDPAIGRKVVREMVKQDPEEAAAVLSHLVNGLMFGEKGLTNYTTGQEVAGNVGGMIAHSLPGRGVGKTIKGVTTPIFAFNKGLEQTALYGALGKYARRQMQEMTGSWFKALRAQDAALKDFAKGLKDTENQQHAAEFLDETLGKYSRFSPDMRRVIQGYAPFLPWYLNSVRFVLHTLPVRHPVQTAILTQAEAVFQKDWEAQHPGNAGKGSLKTAIPSRGGFVDASRFTPFGLTGPMAAGEFSSLAGVVLPQTSGLQLGLLGVDPFGQPLKGPKTTGNPQGTPNIPLYALNQLAESYVPGLGLARRFREKGRKSLAGSTVFSPKTSEPGAGQPSVSAPNRIFNPFRPVYISASRAGGGKLSPAQEAVLKAYQRSPAAQSTQGGLTPAQEAVLKAYKRTHK